MRLADAVDTAPFEFLGARDPFGIPEIVPTAPDHLRLGVSEHFFDRRVHVNGHELLVEQPEAVARHLHERRVDFVRADLELHLLQRRRGPILLGDIPEKGDHPSAVNGPELDADLDVERGTVLAAVP